MEISVIIPVYNSEKYIKRCVKSVLEQTYTDFELILVNDGSTDLSLEIIKELSLTDSRIVVHSQKNSGAAVARNKGIELSSGKYVTFIDSDDYVEIDYLKTLYCAAENENADLAVCCIQWYKNGQTELQQRNRNALYTDYKYASAVFDGELDYISSYGPCAKLIKRSIISKNGVFFPAEYKLSEDRIFNIRLLKYIEKAVICDYIGYTYFYENNDSLTHNRSSFEVMQNILKAEEAVYKEYGTALHKLKLWEQKEFAFYEKKLSAFLSMDYLISVSNSTKKEKAKLYDILIGLIQYEEIQKIRNGFVWAVLNTALKTKQASLMRLWLYVMRMKQKFK